MTAAGPERAGDSGQVLSERLGPEAGVGAESVAFWKTDRRSDSLFT